MSPTTMTLTALQRKDTCTVEVGALTRGTARREEEDEGDEGGEDDDEEEAEGAQGDEGVDVGGDGEGEAEAGDAL